MATHRPVILLVDDDPDFLDMNRHVLEAREYRVVCAPDPQSALAGMEEHQPDLIITDLMMEDLGSGFSFARRIKEHPRFSHVPIIIVTAASSRRGFDFRPNSPKELSAMYVDAYFDKPVSPDALVAKIEELLRNPTEKEPT